jgi:hypothetical protein
MIYCDTSKKRTEPLQNCEVQHSKSIGESKTLFEPEYFTSVVVVLRASLPAVGPCGVIVIEIEIDDLLDRPYLANVIVTCCHHWMNRSLCSLNLTR